MMEIIELIITQAVKVYDANGTGSPSSVSQSCVTVKANAKKTALELK